MDINIVGGLTVDPLVLLLGTCDMVATNTHKKLFVIYAAFYARKAIVSKRKLPEPPSVSQWRSTINSNLHLYKLTYMSWS